MVTFISAADDDSCSGAELTSRHWKLAGARCASQTVGSHTAIFDFETGETLLLNELPALILGVLGDTPLPRTVLIDRLAGPVRLHHEDELRIDEALVYLENAGLAVSCGRDTD